MPWVHIVSFEHWTYSDFLIRRKVSSKGSLSAWNKIVKYNKYCFFMFITCAYIQTNHIIVIMRPLSISCFGKSPKNWLFQENWCFAFNEFASLLKHICTYLEFLFSHNTEFWVTLYRVLKKLWRGIKLNVFTHLQNFASAPKIYSLKWNHCSLRLRSKSGLKILIIL